MCVFSLQVYVFSFHCYRGIALLWVKKNNAKWRLGFILQGSLALPRARSVLITPPCHFEKEINSLCLQLSVLTGQRGLANHYGKRAP